MDDRAGRALSQWVAKCVVVNHNRQESVLKKQKTLYRKYRYKLSELELCEACDLLTDVTVSCCTCGDELCKYCQEKCITCFECDEVMCKPCCLLYVCGECVKPFCRYCNQWHAHNEKL